MIKKLATLFVILLVASSIALSQWTQSKTFSYKAVLRVANLWGPHGVAVDPEGKIWFCPYEATDTLTLGSSSANARREIFVFNPNGTPASFSPIKVILGDSLNNNNSSRGIKTDADGNILYSSFNRIFKINYKTGVGIAKVEISQFGGNSITAAASDSAGNIFVTRVSNANQAVRIYDKNLSYLGNAVDSIKTGSLSRTITVSGDGKTLYLAQFGSKRVFVYYSA
ncbi:MAG: hypothetical protein HYV29_04755, partial [Ignavibacteriales bacterium]|nr:hypothetical protein [Ignavibacteriales bacterium]